MDYLLETLQVLTKIEQKLKKTTYRPYTENTLETKLTEIDVVNTSFFNIAPTFKDDEIPKLIEKFKNTHSFIKTTLQQHLKYLSSVVASNFEIAMKTMPCFRSNFNEMESFCKAVQLSATFMMMEKQNLLSLPTT